MLVQDSWRAGQRDLHRITLRLGQRSHGVDLDVTEEVAERCEWKLCLPWARPGGEHSQISQAGAFEGGSKKRRLADPRFAFNDECSLSACRSVEEAGQDGQL